MNKIYRLVWSRELGAMVVASELATGHMGGSGAVVEKRQCLTLMTPLCRAMVPALLLFCGLAGGGVAWAQTVTPVSSIPLLKEKSSDVGDDCNWHGSTPLATSTVRRSGVCYQGSYVGTTGDPLEQVTVIGSVNYVTVSQSVAVGNNVVVTGNSGIAIGSDDTVDARKIAEITNSTLEPYFGLTGARANDTYRNLMAADKNGIYYGTSATGQASLAVGAQSQAQGDFSTVLGFNSFATGTGALALGGSAIASKTGSVALGTGATTGTDAADIDTAVIGGRTFTGFAGTVGDSGMQVSVGAAGYERQVKNVAAGALTAASTDAVNGSQLYAVANTLGSGQMHYYSVRSSVTGVGSNYDNDGASGVDAIAVGSSAGSSGARSISMGYGASAGGEKSIAIGARDNSGINAKAEAGNSIALGSGANASASAAGGIAIGSRRHVNNEGGDELLNDMNSGARVYAINGIAIGSGSVSGKSGVVVPSEADFRTIAIGDLANVQGTQSMGVGAGIVIGVGSKNSSAVGFSSAVGRTALGAISYGSVDSGTAIGANAQVLQGGNYSTAVGARAVVAPNVINAIAMGGAANTPQAGTSTSANRGAYAAANNSVALGVSSRVNAGATSGVAIGDSSVTTGANAIAIGKGAQAIAGNTIAIGTGNQVSGANSGAIGDPNTVKGSGSYALGNNNTIAQDNTFVVGNGVTATQANSVVLGNASADRAATAVSSTSINGVTYNYAGVGSAANGVVSVGAAGKERQIVNVAAGQVSASSTDAVNGSQLFATNQAVSALGNRAVQYDVNTDGTVNRGSITLGSAGTGTRIGNVANGTSANDAVNLSQLETAKSDMTSKGMKFTGNDKTAGDVHRNLGETLAIQGGASSAGNYSGGNLKTVTDPTTGAINLQMADAPKFGGVTINVDGGGKITGVTAGTLSSASTDAVNGSQLYQTNQTVQNLGNTTVKALGGGSTYDPATGAVTAILNVGGKTYNSVNEAVDAVNATASAGWNLSANGDAASNVASGGTVTVQQGNNIAVTRDGTDPNKLTIATTSDLTITSVTAGNTVLNNGGVTVSGGPKGPVSLTNVGLDNGGNTITGVAAGTLSAASTDAVNGSQLYTTNQSVNNVASSLASGMGGNSTANADGTVTTVLNVGGKTYNSVNDAIGAVNATASAGWNLTAQGANGSNVAPGATVDLSSTDGNLKVTKSATDNNVTFGLNPDLTITSVTAGNTRIDTNGLTNGGTTVNSNGLTIAGGPSVTTAGIDAGNKIIGNVANGVSATDAVNLSQLNTVAATASAANERAVKYDWTDTNGNGEVDPGEVDYARVTMNPGAAATTIHNVAAGEVSATSNQAVNGSQLHATNQAVSALGNRAVQYDLNADGTVNSNSVTLNKGGTATQIHNVANGTSANDAVNLSQLETAKSDMTSKGMKFTGNDNGAGEVHRDLGQTLAIKGEAATAGSYSGGNLKTVTDPTTGAINLQMADAPKFGGVTINVDGGGKITGVTAGALSSASTDAVNGSQLYQTNQTVQKLGDTTATALGGGSTYDPATGTVTAVLNVGGKTYDNVSEAIGAVSATASAGWRLTAQGADGSNVAPGATVDLSSTDGNLKVTKSAADNNVTFGLNSDLTLTSITTGNTVMDTNGLSVDDGAGKVARYGAARVEMSDGANSTTLDANGLAVAGGPSITVSGIDAGGMPIANVGAGVNPTDAVNMSQLNAVGNLVNAGWTVLDANGNQARITPDGRVTFTGDENVTIRQTGADQEGKVEVALNRNLSVDSLTTGGTLLNANGLTIAGGPSLTVAGIDAGGQPITHVGTGINPTDAVNLAQLNAASMEVKTHYYGVNSIGGGNYDNDGATGTDAIAIGKDALASHDGSIALGNGARTTDAVATPSGTIAGVDYRYAGANPHAVLSIGAVGMERVLVNVAAGRISADSTDAVNGSQLHAAHRAVEAVDGRVTDLSGRVDGVTSNINNLANRVDASEVNIAAIQNGAAGMFQVNQPGGKAPAPTGANSAAGGSDAVASGNNSTAVGNQSVADGANSTAIGQGARATGSSSIAIGAGSTAVEDNVVSVGGIGAERRITNVAPGVNGTDAVNLNQLKGYAAGGVQYDKNPDGSVNYNSMTLNPGGTGPTLVRNVAAGVAPTDAVNVGQLKAGLSDTLNKANAYTDQRFNDLSNDVWTLRRDFRGATASAMAMAGLPQAYLPGKSMLSAGVGGYQGQYGIAVGLSGISENGTWVYKAQASGNTAKDWGFSAGMGVQW
ncbi:hypothetical protein EBB59_08265 [Lysobacter pythonis]|uniref:Uncharacterized protein n=1 Tax=Solilutibacter pythonis TaxID=2483112 RepID=A0A3M2HN41_9GAMM|nr:YadA-like family protein [Lysobacter pythonis]RMH91126.1 hypothetical protein EBB59_08265 [Lysobacter pythonis]